MRALLRACFFLSGASGLVFELCWTRLLTLVFGSTTLAISTVLTAFMGGLGLGSYLAGRVADRLREPARAYAVLEASVGLYALAVPLVVSLYPALNRWLWDAFGDRYAALSLLRFTASAGLLLLPTTLMGATLPVLARAFVTRPYEIGRVGDRLGSLYAMNLFGAVTGAFLAGFVFLPTLGVRATNVVAASFNLLLAAAVMVARRLWASRPPPRPSLEEMAAELLPGLARPAVITTPASRRTVLAGFLLSGLVAMTLQVLWTRVLAVVMGSSVFSFTLILLAFLVGLGGGSAAFGRLADRDPTPVRSLGLLHLCVAAAVGLSYVLTDLLPFLFTWLCAATGFNVDATLFWQFVLACVSVLPATFLMGGVFPLTMRVVNADFGAVGRSVGAAYALNTVGAIAGSFLSGFVVLPMLGLQRGIYLAVLVGLGLAAALFALAPGLPRARRALGVGVAAAMAVGGLLLPRWDLMNFSAGFFRVSVAKDYLDSRERKEEWHRPKLVFYEDGIATTVSVENWGQHHSLKNNGKVDASSSADMPTQIGVGLLPLLLYPHDVDARPPRVALIGFGSGVTAGSITQFPIASLEVIELEPAIYRASHFFDEVNHRPLANPKVVHRVGDGRNFLTQRRDRFDVIVSEPSNPWITGVSNLFTREYFRSVRERLADDGIFCQWAQLYEMAPWNVKTIYRTLREEFPHVLVFAPEDLSSDTILVASARPIRIDLPRIARLMANPTTAAEAERAGFQTPYDVPAFLLLGPDEIEAFTAGAPVNTDDNARIEFAAPRDLLGQGHYDSYLSRVYGRRWPYGRLGQLLAGHEGPDRALEMARLARALLAHGKSREAELWADKARAAGGGAEAEQARLLLDLIETRDNRDPELALAPAGDLAPPVLPSDLAPALGERIAREYTEVDTLCRQDQYAAAYKLVDAWPSELTDRLGQDMALLSGFLHYKVELYGDAIDQLRPLEADAAYVARRPAVLYYLGRAYFANANHASAVRTLERFISVQRAAGGPLLPASAQAGTKPGTQR